MVNRVVCAAVSCGFFLSGCATPGQPGSGAGAGYTPIVDTQGIDQGAFERDLTDCRRFAGLIDAQGAAVSGAVAGAMLEAAISAAFGLRGRDAGHNATYGAIAGGTRASAGATRAQERVLMNCLIGRGYRPLEVSGLAPVAPLSPPLPIATIVPTVAVATAVPAVERRPSAPTPDILTVAAAQSTPGDYGVQAERLARTFPCAGDPTFVAKGAGFESYSIVCLDRDPILLRCNAKSCREMK